MDKTRSVFRIRRPIMIACLIALTGVLAACESGVERQQSYLESAHQHFNNGNYAKAKVDVRNVLQIQEHHAEARYLYALILEQDKDWPQMFANLQHAIELAPEFVAARIKIGHMYYQNRLYIEAMNQADTALVLQPNNPEALSLKSGVLYRQGQLDGAVEYARQVLNFQPGHVGATSILTEVYRAKYPEKALAVIDDGITRQDQKATLRLLKISVLEEQGKIDAAIAEYKILIDEYPENLFFHYRLVTFYEKHGRANEAEGILRNIIRAKPDDIELKLWLGTFFVNQKNLVLAEDSLKKYIEREPNIYELRFALGKIYVSLKRYDDAEKVYNEIVAMDGEGADSLQARNEIVKLKLLHNDRVKAQAILDDILALEKQNEPALLTTARLAFADGDAKEAIINLRTILKNNPKSLDSLLLLGQAHESEQAYDLALDSFRNALVVKPNSTAAILNVARMQVNRGEFKSSELLLERLLEKEPNNTEAIRILVASYNKQSRWKDALEKVESLMQAKNTRVLGLYLKVRVLLAQDNVTAAIPLLEKVMLLEPTAIEGLSFLVHTYQKVGKSDVAHRYLLSHVKKYDDQAHAFALLGESYAKRDTFDRAINAYRRAIQLAPTTLAHRVALARLYRDREDYSNALKVHKDALAQFPNNVNVMLLIAGIYERQSNFKTAVKTYEQVLAQSPNMNTAANNLALLLLKHYPTEENLQRALTLTQRFRTSDVPEYRDTLGWVYYKMNIYSQALSIFQKIVKERSDPVYKYHLGMTYFQLKNMDAAKKELQSAVDGGVDFPGIKEARDTLKAL